jgi:dihydrofolate synthase / folylpolyglutamate synthase
MFPQQRMGFMTRTLAEWLEYQEHVNVHSIELGLDRVRTVWERMGAMRPAPLVITVGGTNGKGSTVSLLEAMLTAAGHRVGCFVSPHLLAYNERIRIDGMDADDVSLVASFERIESARAEIPLTYFEFGTLAALDLHARAGVEVSVLEVGLGGRLDAVNIVDADAAIVTTIDLDHQDWLGSDRDSIGREKAGIARRDRPAVVGETEPPAGLLGALDVIGAQTIRAGVDFHVEREAEGYWRWRHADGTVFELPDPALSAPCQHANAAAAIAALHVLRARVACPPEAIASGLRTAHVPGRLQQLGGVPAVIVDVAHNPQAARALAAWLDAQPAGRVQAVYGALADKDVAGVMLALGGRVQQWHLAGLDNDTPRGLSATALARTLLETLPGAVFEVWPGVTEALKAAQDNARPGDRILAFGSFFVASAVLAVEQSRSEP